AKARMRDDIGDAESQNDADDQNNGSRSYFHWCHLAAFSNAELPSHTRNDTIDVAQATATNPGNVKVADETVETADDLLVGRAVRADPQLQIEDNVGVGRLRRGVAALHVLNVITFRRQQSLRLILYGVDGPEYLRQGPVRLRQIVVLVLRG